MTITTNNESSLIQSVQFYFPYFFDLKKSGTVLRTLISTIAYAFNINIQQMNEMFTNTFIMEAEDEKLNDLIMGISGIKRKNNESNADYRTRYFKYCYQYNATNGEINNIVNDITGLTLEKLVEGNSHEFYWGEPNVSTVGIKRHYYNDIGQYTALWGSSNGEKAFIGYIFLKERPTDDKLQELIDVLELVRMKGTTIYLVIPQIETTIFDISNSSGTGDRFISEINSPQNDLIIVQDSNIFLFDIQTNSGNTIEDFTTLNNDGHIIELTDNESIFTWLMEDLLFNDLTTNNNDGILIQMATTDVILTSILAFLPSTTNNPINDLSLNNNDVLISDIPDPTILFEFDMGEE